MRQKHGPFGTVTIAAFVLVVAFSIAATVHTAATEHAKSPVGVKSPARAKPPESTLPTLRPEWIGGTGGVFYRNMVVVLTWHNIAPKGVYDTISVQNFALEMQALRQDNFHPVSPALFSRFIQHKAKVPDNAVLLTFDNGCVGVYTYGWPIIERYRYPVLLFPVFGRTNVQPGFFTSGEILTMVHSGLATLGSHTYAEHYGAPAGLTTSGPADIVRIWNGHFPETLQQYDARVENDAQRAMRAIQSFAGRKEPYFSDPFGQYTPRLLGLLSRAGFTEDFTTLGWAVTQSTPADRLPRINVGTGTSAASSMVGATLDVARLTAQDPTWYPPASWTTMWP